MALRSTNTRWGWVTRVLHWSIALAVLGMLAAGLYAVKLVHTGTPAGDKLFYTVIDIHKSFGLLILMLMVIRVLWRLSERTPKLSAVVPPVPLLERIVARVAHLLLYIGLFVQPISGYLWASAYGEPVRFFGVKLPHLVTLTGPSIRLARHIHDAVAYVLLVIVVLHILGALKNHFIDRNQVLRNMAGLAPDTRTAPKQAAPADLGSPMNAGTG
jgi:cytochrome b561